MNSQRQRTVCVLGFIRATKPFGNVVLVEQCRKIRISDLLKESRGKLRETMVRAKIEALGMKLELATSDTPFKGVRYWFCCPLCRARVGVVYLHPVSGLLGCRKCLKLDYRKRRYKGMTEGRIGEIQ